MSVRKLAGPFLLQMLDKDGNLFAAVTASTYDATWFPHVGLLMTARFTLGNSEGLHVFTFDGITSGIRSRYGYSQTWGWWPSRLRMVTMVGVEEQVLEPKAFVVQGISPDEKWPNNLLYRFVKLDDRLIYIRSWEMWRWAHGVPEAAESGNIFQAVGIQPHAVYAGRGPTDMWVNGLPVGWTNFDRSCGCFYDTISHTVVSPRYSVKDRCDMLLYAPEFGVLVSVYGDSTQSDPEHSAKYFVSVWSLEVEPTILSAPQIVSGTARAGQFVTYQVRLTGDHNDGAEGELINWSLAGAGVLCDVQTLTDANGYATARVQYRVGETGDSTVTASVSC